MYVIVATLTMSHKTYMNMPTNMTGKASSKIGAHNGDESGTSSSSSAVSSSSSSSSSMFDDAREKILHGAAGVVPPRVGAHAPTSTVDAHELIGTHVAASQAALGVATHVDPSKVDLYNKIARAIHAKQVSPSVGLGLMHVAAQAMHKQAPDAELVDRHERAIADIEAIRVLLQEHEAATGAKLSPSFHRNALRVGIDIHGDALSDIDKVLQADNPHLPKHMRGLIAEFDKSDVGKRLAAQAAQARATIGASASSTKAAKSAKAAGTKKSHSRIGADVAPAYSPEEVQNFIATLATETAASDMAPKAVGAKAPMSSAFAQSAYGNGEYHSDE